LKSRVGRRPNPCNIALSGLYATSLNGTSATNSLLKYPLISSKKMEISERYKLIFETAKMTTEKALQLFDALEPVNLDFMLGRWQGSELHTSHPMDGLLEASNWYGKEFINPENVHPLLFLDNQKKIIKVAPNPIAMNWVLKFPVIKNDFLKPLLMLTNSLLKTEKSQARLRMMEYREKVSATMIYDYLPINDSFRKVDENTVLGIMDFKNLPQPFFFVLNRSSQFPSSTLPIMPVCNDYPSS
jgi:hypothetical protein